MLFQSMAAAALIVVSAVPASANPATDVALRFTCDGRASKAVVAVGYLDAIKNVVGAGSLSRTIDLDRLPRQKETRLCRFGSITISIVPLISGEHPRNDNAYVLVNGIEVERTFWNMGEYGVMTVVPDAGGLPGLDVRVCRVHVNQPASSDERSSCAPLDRP